MIRLWIAGVALCAGLAGTAAQERPAAKLHHFMINSLDPAASVEFYARSFEVTRRVRVAGFEGVQSDDVYLLFNKAEVPAPTELTTAIGHVGWGVASVPEHHAKLVAEGVWTRGPVGTLAGGSQFVNFVGPNGELIEINPSREFVLRHLHLYSNAPVCAAEWYQKHLGIETRTPPGATGPCDRPYDAPGEPFHIIRGPSGSLNLGQVGAVIHPRQPTPASLGAAGGHWPKEPASTRGHVFDHIAFTYPDVAAELERLRRAGVTVLQDLQPFGTSTRSAAIVEGPDRIAIMLLQPE